MSTTDLRPTSQEPVLPLQCASWRSFADRYVDDLARGALCLAYPEPLPLLSTVHVQLGLPDSVEITLHARVVQVITGTLAEQLGGAYALALEIMDLEGESKRQLGQLVEFARSQQNGEDDSTSFARTMLERTPSLPPRELAARLSQLPAAAPPPSAAPRRALSIPLEPGSGDSGYRHTAAARRLSGSDVTRPLSPSRTVRAIRGKGEELHEPVRVTAAPPPDPIKVKDLLSNVARKQYDAALRISNELLEVNPGDRQAQRWRAVCYARIALSRNDNVLAAQAYQTMLELDPSDREARDFLKAHERTKKLESLPFGRFFTKKK